MLSGPPPSLASATSSRQHAIGTPAPAEHPLDPVVVEDGREAVRAEQEPVAVPSGDTPELGLGPGSRSERAGDDVPAGMVLRLGRP